MGKPFLEAIAIRSTSRATMRQLKEVRITLGHGVNGDFRGNPGSHQVTGLLAEAWENARLQHWNRSSLDHATSRMIAEKVG